MISISRSLPDRVGIRAALLLALGLAGCTPLDPQDDRSIQGMFVATPSANDTLVFRDDFTGTIARGVAPAGPDGASSWRRSFIWSGVDGAFALTIVCAPNELCAQGPHYYARLVHDELLLDPALTESSEPRTRFRRAGP